MATAASWCVASVKTSDLDGHEVGRAHHAPTVTNTAPKRSTAVDKQPTRDEIEQALIDSIAGDLGAYANQQCRAIGPGVIIIEEREHNQAMRYWLTTSDLAEHIAQHADSHFGQAVKPYLERITNLDHSRSFGVIVQRRNLHVGVHFRHTAPAGPVHSIVMGNGVVSALRLGARRMREAGDNPQAINELTTMADVFEHAIRATGRSVPAA